MRGMARRLRWQPRSLSCFMRGPCFRVIRPLPIGRMTSPITSPFAADWIVPRVRSPVADLLADLGSAFAGLDVQWS